MSTPNPTPSLVSELWNIGLAGVQPEPKWIRELAEHEAKQAELAEQKKDAYYDRICRG